MKALAARLRENRERLGFTQEALAEALKIDVRDYQRIEAGERNVTVRTLCHLADVLHVHPSVLLGKR